LDLRGPTSKGRGRKEREGGGRGGEEEVGREGGICFTGFRGVYALNERILTVSKKVKFSHTRYRALGPELIPVYMQSARR